MSQIIGILLYIVRMVQCISRVAFVTQDQKVFQTFITYIIILHVLIFYPHLACFDISVGYSDNSSARVHTRTAPAAKEWCLI